MTKNVQYSLYVFWPFIVLILGTFCFSSLSGCSAGFLLKPLSFAYIPSVNSLWNGKLAIVSLVLQTVYSADDKNNMALKWKPQTSAHIHRNKILEINDILKIS